MKNLSWIKRVSLLRDYYILIKRNRSVISNKSNGLNLRIDSALRIYTVYNCPDDLLKYGDKVNIAQNYIREYISKVDRILMDIGMTEYVGIWNIEQLNELDFLIVFGFKGLNTASFFRNGTIILISTFSISIFLLIYFLF